MHEIITISTGRANYTAAHFFNEQESLFSYSDQEEPLVDHEVHFRAGIGADGHETYLPRSLIYDLRDNFGSMRQINALYEIAGDSEPLWDQPATVITRPPVEPHRYQQTLESGLVPPRLSDETVRYWSDYNRVFYHPRSIIKIDEQQFGSRAAPFEKWETGDEIFETLDKESDLLDRDFRPFLEESDALQGVKILSSIDDAWGAFTARYLEQLRDDLGKTSIWVFGATSLGKREERVKKNLKLNNVARSIGKCSGASLFVPMEEWPRPIPTYLKLNPPSQWRVAGLHSAAISTVTLPSRLKGIAKESWDATEILINMNGNQNIAQLSLGIPQPDEKVTSAELAQGPSEVRESLPITHNGTDGSISEQNSDGPATSQDALLFPRIEDQLRQRNGGRSLHTFSTFKVVRVEKRGKSKIDIQEQIRMHTIETHVGYPLLDSFPHVFEVSTGGEAASLNLHGSLEVSSAIGSLVRQLKKHASGNVEEREDLSNKLEEIAEQYREGWEGELSSDDDDG
ncbi:MAG: mtDNA inheritance, partitioning of the mitochondrial organelle [Vezdaea aestivalis]|nr:MAG: mtDNA inheritance, partitioning of the mitochondrial organelle [Vezdaea aestivalis]